MGFELLLLSAGGVVVTLWGLSCCYLVGFELLLLSAGSDSTDSLKV